MLIRVVALSLTTLRAALLLCGTALSSTGESGSGANWASLYIAAPAEDIKTALRSRMDVGADILGCVGLADSLDDLDGRGSAAASSAARLAGTFPSVLR